MKTLNLQQYKKIDNLLYLLAYLFFAIPTLIFFTFWYKWYISIPVITILITIPYLFKKTIKYKTLEQYKAIFNYKKWLIVIVLLLVLNILSGIGGFAFQNGDHNARNAVMHDLINYDWPVKYHYEGEQEINLIGENGYLSYYFVYWLPSALFGKLFGFMAANIVLFVYQFCGLLLFYYFMSRIFNKIRLRYFFVFVAFSGLDVIGQYLVDKDFLTEYAHIDTWSPYFCFSSNITQLFWVFNQGVTTWLITSLLLNENSFKNVAIYMMFILLFSPFPAVGYALMILLFSIFGIYQFENKIENKGFINNFKEMFSIQNIISLFILLFIIMFLLVNPSGQRKGFVFQLFKDLDIYYYIKCYIRFWLLEFGIISILAISKKNFKWIIGTILFLSLIPFYYIGSGADFVNRVSLPMLFFIMLFVIEKLNNFNWKNIIHILIILYLSISCITGLHEIKRSLYRTIEVNKFSISKNFNDNWMTYGKIVSQDVVIYIKNFSSSYDSERFVFKYILK